MLLMLFTLLLIFSTQKISSPVMAVGAMLLLTLLSILYCIRFDAQRLHDIGFSAWWQLCILIPVLGQLFMLTLLLLPGHRDYNAYGPPPPPNGKKVYLSLLVLLLAIGALFANKEKIELMMMENMLKNSG